MAAQENSSISLLDIPWETNSDQIKSNKIYLSGPSIESTFFEYDIQLPSLFKDTYPFFYNSCEDNFVKIFKNENLLVEIQVQDIYQITGFSTKKIFILNRNKLYKECKRNNLKEYKQSVFNNNEYLPSNFYKNQMNKILDAQIKSNINFCYLEDKNDLIREIKSAIKSFSIQDYVPKVKKFRSNEKELLLIEILQYIPGISRNCAVAVQKKFVDLKSLMENQSELENVEVLGDDGFSKRNLDRQAGIIRQYLGIPHKKLN